MAWRLLIWVQNLVLPGTNVDFTHMPWLYQMQKTIPRAVATMAQR